MKENYDERKKDKKMCSCYHMFISYDNIRKKDRKYICE